VTARTTLINQLRAILLERDIVIPKGRRALNEALTEILIDPSPRISERMRQLVGEMQAERQALDQRVAALDRELLQRARADAAARRLVTIPGIGALNATALLAAVGDASAFRRGRDLAAWLGLVPRQQTTGGRPKLLGITKRGNKYLRMLFIHGARAAMPWLANTPTPLGEWLRRLMARAHRNVAIVALANKLARIAWTTLRRGSRFEAGRAATAA
jgi:transposase